MAECYDRRTSSNTGKCTRMYICIDILKSDKKMSIIDRFEHRILLTVSMCSLWIAVALLNSTLNPLTAKLFNLNFHPLEVVSRWRDPQLQVRENY